MTSKETLFHGLSIFWIGRIASDEVGQGACEGGAEWHFSCDSRLEQDDAILVVVGLVDDINSNSNIVLVVGLGSSDRDESFTPVVKSL